MPQDAAGYHTAPTRYRTFAVSWKSRPSGLQLLKRVWAAAQQRPSKLASAFAWHHTCRPLEVTRADSRDQHVQTPEVAKQDKKGQKP